MAVPTFFFSALLLVRAADLSEAEPTLTHMSIACLHKHNLVSCFFLTSLMFCLRVINPAGKRKIFRILFDYVFWLKCCISMEENVSKPSSVSCKLQLWQVFFPGAFSVTCCICTW